MASAALLKRPRHFQERRLLASLSRQRKRGRHRNKRQTFWHRLQEWVWPSMGWGALLRWHEIRLHRAKGTAHQIALGLAIGAGAAFYPMIFQSILAMSIAWLLRGSIIAAFIASNLGNPWTFPFLWGWTYWLGKHILQQDVQIDSFSNALVMQIWHDPASAWDKFMVPALLGAVPTSLIVAMIVYVVLYRNIQFIQTARENWLKHRQQQEDIKTYRARLKAKIAQAASTLQPERPRP